MRKRLYLLIIEMWWRLEHFKSERIAVIAYRYRKLWERKYVARFKENIYGQSMSDE